MTQALEAKLTADTSGFNASIVQAANLTNEQMKKIAQYVTSATSATANMSRAAQTSASTVSGAYGQIAASADHVRSAHAGVNRELLVLTHELSQGNFTRFGGSMLVLAERTNALQFAMTGAGAATLAIGGALLGTVALIAKGAIDADKFAKSLQLTGNYAAITADQLRVMAAAQSFHTGQTPGGARESLEAVAGSGLFGPAQVAAAARALGDYQKLTGEAAEDAIKKFKSIQDGVAKWAEEENRSVHFLTLTEFDHIKALEESGNKQQAVIETLNAYSSTIEGRAAPSLGMLARAWRAVTDAASNAKQAMMSAGAPGTTDSHLAGLQSQLAELTKRSPRGSSPDMNEELGRGRTRGDQVASLQRQIASVQALAAAEKAARDETAKMEAIQSEAVSGQAYEDSVLREAHAISERTQELDKWMARRDLDAKAGHPMSAANYQSGVDAINKKFADHSAEESAKQYDDLISKIKAFNTTSEEEFSGLSKVTEGQRLMIEIQEQLSKSSAKLNTQQRDSITADAARAASLRDVAAASLAFKKSLTEDADKTVKESVAAFAAQQKAMQAFVRSGTSKVGDIDFQTSQLGKSPDDAAKAQAMRVIDVAANQALEASGGQRLNEILAEQAKQRDAVSAALDRQKAKQDALAASFSTGVDAAMLDFAKKANDDAASARKAFEDMANGATDAIVKFAMTGKFNIKSMVDSVIQDLIRMEAQKAVAALLKAFSSGGGFLSSLFGSLGGSGSAGDSGSPGGFSDNYTGAGNTGSGFANAGAGDYSNAGLANAFGYANGMDYVPYDGFPAILHEGERVTSRQDAAVERNGRGGVSIPIDMRGMSFGAGVDVAGVSQAVRTGMAQVKAEITRQLTTSGRG